MSSFSIATRKGRRRPSQSTKVPDFSAWAATGSLRTDEHTGLLDLVGLATSSPTITPLPHDPPKGTPPPGGALPLPPNAATDSALRELGLGATCRPATT